MEVDEATPANNEIETEAGSSQKRFEIKKVRKICTKTSRSVQYFFCSGLTDTV